MMQNIGRFSGFLAVLLLAMPIGELQAQPQTPLKTIDMPEGGRIVYGTVDGAGTQGDAMVSILRIMHQNCGAKPEIGKVFKMRGTDSAGLFFTVLNHPAGNVQVAGLILASQSVPGQAALVSDRADRFSQTVHPMLTRLFSVWHPGNVSSAFAGSQSASSAPPAHSKAVVQTIDAQPSSPSGHSAPAVRLHTVAAPDNSAAIGIPDGWALEPNSGHGTMIVKGPEGEVIAINMMKTGIDPTHPQQISLQRSGIRSAAPGTIVYPFRGNLMKEFEILFQGWRRSNGKPPARLQIETIEPMPTGQGNHCVHVRGQIDPDGAVMQTMDDMMCAMDPGEWGVYTVTLSHAIFANDLAARMEPTKLAILNSYRMNPDVINQENAALLRQKQENDRAITQNTQTAIDRIHQIGAQATARMNATQAANEAQHAGYWAQQESNARNNQSYTNNFRDQTVVRDVLYPNEHATVYNLTATWLQQAFPDRVEEVPLSQYIKGQDF